MRRRPEGKAEKPLGEAPCDADVANIPTKGIQGPEDGHGIVPIHTTTPGRQGSTTTSRTCSSMSGAPRSIPAIENLVGHTS